jgi:PKHD-type hydroxylase
MPYMLNQVVPPDFAPYVFHDKFLTPEECARIVELRNVINAEKAIIGTDGVTNLNKRSSDVRWINWADSVDWIFRKISDALLATNAKYYRYNLAGFAEPLQLTHYRAEDAGHYDWHQDWGPGPMQARKLSIVIPLSDGYEGGEFEMHDGPLKEASRGSMIIFPSFQLHRVKPVTKGERWSLVSWVTGPPFA